MTEERTTVLAIEQYNKIADRLANCNVSGAYSNIVAFGEEFATLGQFLCDSFNYSGETNTKLFAVLNETTRRVDLIDA